jgi:hypothetical protein
MQGTLGTGHRSQFPIFFTASLAKISQLAKLKSKQNFQKQNGPKETSQNLKSQTPLRVKLRGANQRNP